MTNRERADALLSGHYADRKKVAAALDAAERRGEWRILARLVGGHATDCQCDPCKLYDELKAEESKR